MKTVKNDGAGYTNKYVHSNRSLQLPPHPNSKDKKQEIQNKAQTYRTQAQYNILNTGSATWNF